MRELLACLASEFCSGFLLGFFAGIVLCLIAYALLLFRKEYDVGCPILDSEGIKEIPAKNPLESPMSYEVRAKLYQQALPRVKVVYHRFIRMKPVAVICPVAAGKTCGITGEKCRFLID